MASTPETSVTTVIFDLGGVLSSSGRALDVVKRFPDHPADEVMAVMLGDYAADTDHPWHRLERGEISLDDYRSAVGRLIGEAGFTMREPEPSTPRQGLNFEFVRSDDMFRLVHDLRDHGCRLGVLTNNIREFRDRWRSIMDFDTLFDDVVDSHEVGMRKPHRSIYELSLSRLGAQPHEAAFLDDMEVNVRAAEPRSGCTASWWNWIRGQPSSACGLSSASEFRGRHLAVGSPRWADDVKSQLVT